jgi:hypothetical protein
MKTVRFMQTSALSVEGKMCERITLNNRNSVFYDVTINVYLGISAFTSRTVSLLETTK